MDIETLYNAHFQSVYKFFYFKSLNQAAAEDLSSQTFLIMVEKMYDDSTAIENYKKFLYGIMRNVWLRHLQEKYRLQEQLIENIDDFEAYVHHELEREAVTSDEERIKKYIDMLPRSQQRVMTLRLLEHKELSEICSALDKDMNYVKTTQKRAIKSLQNFVQNEAPEVNT